MAPKLQPPNRKEVIGVPIFSIVWYADPADGSSYVAYSGGGGSSRTGIHNKIGIHINNAAEAIVIPTGTVVGVFLHIYCNSLTKKLWMLVSFDDDVQRFSLSSTAGGCKLDGSLATPDKCTCISVNAMADRMALGCDNGLVLVYPLVDDEPFGSSTMTTPLFRCSQHTAAVCAVTYSLRGNRFLSCAKDGTTCVWRESDGAILHQVKCEVDPPPPETVTRSNRRPRPTRPLVILVRGCAFGDLQGQVFYTVASAQRGKAFLSRWVMQQEPKKNDAAGEEAYVCQDRIACSDHPVAAMALSQDGRLLALGNTNGEVTLWSTADWKPLRVFKDVHALGLTSVAPRPYAVRLRGEDEDDVEVHVRTASGEGTLAHLTLQKRAPRSRSGGGGDGIGCTIMLYIHRSLLVLLLVGILSPIYQEAVDKCGLTDSLRRCLVEDVLIAPAWRPGITVPPY